MAKRHVTDFQPVDNICNQTLREVERNSEFSVAHVVMNPLAQSLPHFHKKTSEVYIITQGYGQLKLGRKYHYVSTGSVFEIPPFIPHTLINKSAGPLEHLVIAHPPFDPSDVHLTEMPAGKRPYSFALPKAQDCFDGAKIIPYYLPHLSLSIAFGWVANSLEEKSSHYHKETKEWMYIVSGRGLIELNGVRSRISQGNWISIDPKKPHSLINNKNAEDLVAVCICSPPFQMGDVYYTEYK